jgi:hypothetical protein
VEPRPALTGKAEPRPRSATALRRIAGAAGLGYVAGVGIENMDILEAPTIGSPVSSIRSYFADQAFGVTTSFAGAIALVFYLIFVAAMFIHVRGGERPMEPSALVALVGGIGGPVLAAVGLTANAILVANSGAGLSDDVTRSVSETYLNARMVSGIFVALFLVGIGVAALRSGALPTSLAWLACAIGVPLAFAPLAALTGDHALRVAVAVAFGFNSLWIFFTSLWLALAGDIPVVAFVRRAAFLVLVVAAGLVGIALLAVPGSTGTFFSWGLEPEPLAAFAGGVYVGSAVVYAAGLAVPWPRVRGLVIGAVVLSVSVFVVTLAHLDVFDFDRLQAWAWVALFGGFSVLTTGILTLGRPEEEMRAGAPLQAWARALLGAIAVLLGALAVALWIDPTGLSGPSPFALAPLGGRFAGSWIALLAVLAGWAALSNRRDEALLPALALVALPAAVLIAALRTISDLEPARAGAAYIMVLALLVAAGLSLLASLKREGLDLARVDG